MRIQRSTATGVIAAENIRTMAAGAFASKALGAVLLIGLGITFRLRHDKRPTAASTDTRNQMES
jgi:hypothetical protein